MRGCGYVCLLCVCVGFVVVALGLRVLLLGLFMCWLVYRG